MYRIFPGGSDGKESSCIAGDLSLIPGLGRSPGEGSNYPLQYSGLENSMDRGALAGHSPWGRKESDLTEPFLLFIYKPETDSKTENTFMVYQRRNRG